jgi:hypothetical protein
VGDAARYVIGAGRAMTAALTHAMDPEDRAVASTSPPSGTHDKPGCLFPMRRRSRIQAATAARRRTEVATGTPPRRLMPSSQPNRPPHRHRRTRRAVGSPEEHDASPASTAPHPFRTRRQQRPRRARKPRWFRHLHRRPRPVGRAAGNATATGPSRCHRCRARPK